MSLTTDLDSGLVEFMTEAGQTITWAPVKSRSSFKLTAYLSPNTELDQVIAGGFAGNAAFNVIVRKSEITAKTAVFTPENGDIITDADGKAYEVASVNTSSIAPFYRLACAGIEQAR